MSWYLLMSWWWSCVYYYNTETGLWHPQCVILYDFENGGRWVKKNMTKSWIINAEAENKKCRRKSKKRRCFRSRKRRRFWKVAEEQLRENWHRQKQLMTEQKSRNVGEKAENDEAENNMWRRFRIKKWRRFRQGQQKTENSVGNCSKINNRRRLSNKRRRAGNYRQWWQLLESRSWQEK